MIKRSRNFVCVRIDPYEAEEHADWVRKLWQGRLTNSVFAILEPNGEDMETRGGRSPSMALGTGQELYDAMDRISDKYNPRSDGTDCIVPDSHSFRHILNTASCDEVALGVVVAPDEATIPLLEEKLREVVWDRSLHGRFHWDIVTADDPEVKERLSGSSRAAGGAKILVVRPGTYGQDGEIIASLDANDDPISLVAGLREAANEFSKSTRKKTTKPTFEWAIAVAKKSPRTFRMAKIVTAMERRTARPKGRRVRARVRPVLELNLQKAT